MSVLIQRYYCTSRVDDAATGPRTQRSLLVRMELEDGAIGWGEALPGTTTGNPDTYAHEMAMLGPLAPPGTVFKRPEILTTRLIGPGDDPASGRGYAAVKMKVGRRPMEEDIARFHRLARVVEVPIRLDANRGLSFENACAFLDVLDNPERIDFFEEPLEHVDELPRLAERFPLQYALDETLQPLDDPTAFLGPGITMVIKPTVIASLGRIQTFIAAAHRAGSPVVFSSAYETAIGMAHVLMMAARVPGPPVGLDTISRIHSRGVVTPTEFLKPVLHAPSNWPRVDVSMLQLLK